MSVDTSSAAWPAPATAAASAESDEQQNLQKAGAVKLSRLCGNHVSVRSPAPVHIGVCYADRAELHTSGRSIAIDQLNCPGHDARGAHLQSHGGSIVIGGLDGAASVHSAGGSIELQVRHTINTLAMLPCDFKRTLRCMRTGRLVDVCSFKQLCPDVCMAHGTM